MQNAGYLTCPRKSNFSGRILFTPCYKKAMGLHKAVLTFLFLREEMEKPSKAMRKATREQPSALCRVGTLQERVFGLNNTQAAFQQGSRCNIVRVAEAAVV